MIVRSPIFAACALSCAALACSGDEGSVTGGELEIAFKLLEGDVNVECRTIASVSAVEVTLLTADGLAPLGGYPKQADCDTGTFRAPSPGDGTYTLEVIARGKVGGDNSGVLYKARRPIALPADSMIEISLAPQAARLSVAWAFEGGNDLTPCDGEVERVDVFVSAGTATQDSYNGSFPCRATPVAIPVFMRPRSYTIELTGYTASGFPVFFDQERLTLVAGANSFTASLAPRGGRLRLDWRFQIGGGAPILECDHADVGAQSISLTVNNAAGGDPVEEEIECVVGRPYVVMSKRFAPMEPLVVDLVTEGVHRFRSVSAFEMPAGDHDLGLLTMYAVGSATIAWSVTSSSACARQAVEGYDLELSLGGTTVLERTGLAAPGSLPLDDLPYATYDVYLAGRMGQNVVCQAGGTREVRGRRNDWDPFDL